MLRLAATRALWNRGGAAANAARPALRALCTAGGDDDAENPMTAPRDAMDYDVVIVGAGPAGLSAGIRLKQLCAEREVELSVCVVEKGAEVGSHILSGNVFEPHALDELLPEWRTMGAPIETPVTTDTFHILPNEKDSYHIPHALLPPQLCNEGNYIISLSQLCRWLNEQAEELGVEVFPGFPASEVLIGEDGGVRGIATADMGIDKDGTPKPTFARGMEINARVTLFGEGCRGSCSKEMMERFNLRDGVQEQVYGLGLKEVWQIPEEQCQPGLVQHTLGWPLQTSVTDKEFGGSFLYHMGPDKVLAGFVVGLDYENPFLSPYEEFQKWKTHPDVSKHLEGGECIAYGARTLIEGGFHSIPKLSMPGGALIGDSAGFLNSVKIKGTHTAMKSGMLAAEAAFQALAVDRDAEAAAGVTGEIPEGEGAVDMGHYQTAVEDSWIWPELKEVRNVHAGFHGGVGVGTVLAGLETHVLKGRGPWTLDNGAHGKDSARTGKAAEHQPREPLKPDGELTFDLLTNLARSGTTHDDHPPHLAIKEDQAHVPESVSLQEFAGPEQRFCPAGVYEYDEDQQLVRNYANCLHCKACDIKTPHEYINWTVPEGGGGPDYQLM